MKKGSSLIADFVLKVKNIGDSLKSAGDEVSDHDFLLRILIGVRHEFDVVVVVLTSQQNSIFVHDAQYMLMIHEQRLEHLNSSSQIDGNPFTNFMANNGHGKGGRRNNNRGGYNSSGRDGGNKGKCRRGCRNGNNNKPTCQICGRIRHCAQKCYNKFDRNYQSLSTSNYGSNNTGSQGQNQTNNQQANAHKNQGNNNNNL
ncbi:hypothetical protein Ddye_024146 [Dipteronia dyeriana]|uniref:CCHC-type domain-containing protein n=1 Tax=Dipteronia dyeriana TaxID=168575 RepID=A0AAD9TVA6_9ROSI|nr:hypothetical protein Ddye_024146 [Dipteronia dyeriana]